MLAKFQIASPLSMTGVKDAGKVSNCFTVVNDRGEGCWQSFKLLHCCQIFTHKSKNKSVCNLVFSKTNLGNFILICNS